MIISTLPAPRAGSRTGRATDNAPPTIFFGTEDGFLIAVNARTGKLVPGFAKEGELDLKPGMKAPEVDNAPYGLNGAPAVYKNLVFTGSHLQDYGSYGGRGDVRAWDTAHGKAGLDIPHRSATGRARPRNLA